jgi:hypothetical protein
MRNQQQKQTNNQTSQASTEQTSKDAQNSGRANKKTAYDPPDKSKQGEGHSQKI